MGRDHSLATCTGKKAYSSLPQARQGKRHLKDKGERSVHIYHCPYCRAWHVGHGIAYLTDYPAYGKAKQW